MSGRMIADRYGSIFVLKKLAITIEISFTATPMIKVMRLASVTRGSPFGGRISALLPCLIEIAAEVYLFLAHPVDVQTAR
jgi:hypothetical protein